VSDHKGVEGSALTDSLAKQVSGSSFMGPKPESDISLTAMCAIRDWNNKTPWTVERNMPGPSYRNFHGTELGNYYE